MREARGALRQVRQAHRKQVQGKQLVLLSSAKTLCEGEASPFRIFSKGGQTQVHPKINKIKRPAKAGHKTFYRVRGGQSVLF